jgi:hypothetical protein
MDVFTVEEATGYLSAKLAEAPGVPAGVLNEAHRLATDLGYLPLALSHAAAVVVNDGITCADYRVLLADRRQRLDEVFPSHAGEAGDEYAHTVAGTWSLARERANLLNPAGLAGPMLDLISMLDPNGIPEVVLTSGPVDIYLQTGQGATGQDPPAGSTLSTPSAATRRVLRNLWRLSLISHDPNDECRSVRIHALAQRAAIEQLSPTAAAAAIHTAADALTSVWPTAEAGTLLGQVLRANASVLAARDPTLLRKPNTHPILFRLGNSLGEAGLVGNAIAHFTTLTSDSGRLLGADHPDTLTARAELARWRGMAGDAAGAVAALEELLTDMLPVLDPDDSRPRAVRAELARWRGVAGDAAGAVAALEELLADLLRTLGPDHAETLAVRGNLAYVLAEAKQWARAVAALEDLLTDRARLIRKSES